MPSPSPGGTIVSSLAAPRVEPAHAIAGPQSSSIHRLPILSLTGPVIGYAVRIQLDLPGANREDLAAALQDGYTHLDIPNLVADRYCFLPATAAILDGFLPVAGAPSHLVIELPRGFAFLKGADQRAASLRKMGVQLALEEYTCEPAQDALLPYVSFVVVDPQVPEDLLAARTRHAHAHGARVIAMGVQDEWAQERCRRNDVDAIRAAYPASRQPTAPPPTTQAPSAPRVLRAAEMQCLAIVDMLSGPDVDYPGVAQLIDTDPVLTVRVLHLVNSGAFGVRHAVDTVHQAVVMLGPKETLALAMALLVDARPDTMDRLWFILARALACETLAGSAVGYTVGMLSSLSEQLGVPDTVILEAVAVTTTVERAIRAESGPLGAALSAVRAHERGDLPGVSRAGFDPSVVSRAYVKAVADGLATALAVSPDPAAV